MRKVALITGASRGIGAATALAFAEAGYEIALNYLSNSEAAHQVKSDIESCGGTAMLIQADVFTENGIRHLFDSVSSEFGAIDVLVNNAGSLGEPALGNWTYEAITHSLTANLTSAMLCTQAAVPLIESGSILFNSSLYGLNFGGNPGLVLYSAGKAAMVNFAQTMAEKLAPRVRCNVVAPGTTKTPAWDGVSPDYVQTSLAMTLQKEWVKAEEIANTFVFLAESPHINAQTIVVDAGWQKKIRNTA